jgi:arylformamidase
MMIERVYDILTSLREARGIKHAASGTFAAGCLLGEDFPDFSIYARKFTTESEAARAGLQCHLNVPYGPTLMENVDIFLPKAGGGKSPILVFIHGGYWKSLTASVFSVMATGPVEAEMCVVNVTYALCPEVEIGEIVRQIRAAVAWTARNAETFGGDPDRIIVSGHSAGGRPLSPNKLRVTIPS